MKIQIAFWQNRIIKSEINSEGRLSKTESINFDDFCQLLNAFNFEIKVIFSPAMNQNYISYTQK